MSEDYPDPMAETPMPTVCNLGTPRWAAGIIVGYEKCGGEVKPIDGFMVCVKCGVSYGPSNRASRVRRRESKCQWEKLPGTYCRIRQDHNKIHAIGHIIEDKWFVPAEMAKTKEAHS